MIAIEDFETEAEREEREAVLAGWEPEVAPDEEPDEFESACCPDPWVAARRLCGCW